MTAKTQPQFNSLTVALDRDMNQDEAESLINAIRQLRGVIRVSGNVADLNSWLAQSRAQCELGTKIIEIIRDFNK